MINPSTLNPVAQELLETLLAFFPDLEVTSGVRSRQSQASAMAGNCIANPKWIGETYFSSPASVACQAAVDRVYGLGEPVTQGTLTVALIHALSVFDAANLRRLSWHLSGDAFDLQPVAGDEGETIKVKINELVSARVAAGGQAKHDKFLSVEGGEVRWHVQAC